MNVVEFEISGDTESLRSNYGAAIVIIIIILMTIEARRPICHTNSNNNKKKTKTENILFTLKNNMYKFS